MDLIKQTKEAFKKAVDRVGGRLVRLQEKTGVNYSAINRLNSGKNKFKDLSLQTFEKLFPEMDITFFRDEQHMAAPPGAELSSLEKKLVRLARELDEDGQFDLLTEAGAIRERHSKNIPRRKQRLPKAG